jgi:hypothetical protein
LVRGKPVETAMVGMVEAILGKYLSQVRALSIYIATSLDFIAPFHLLRPWDGRGNALTVFPCLAVGALV